MTFDDIAKIFEEIELSLVSSLHRNLARHKEWEKSEGFEWAAWQAEKLRNIEKFRHQNVLILNHYTNLIDENTRLLMADQFREGEELAQQQLEESLGNFEEKVSTDIPISDEYFFGVNEDKMSKLINDITTIEKKAETAALRMVEDVYRKMLYKVQLAMGAGSMTLNQAIDLAVKDFLNKGINCIVYKDGRRVNISDYVRMALRTTSTRAKLQGQSKRIAELGYDTVIVSQYGACSDTCLPWQGRVYIDDVFTPWQGETNGDMGKSNYCNKWFPLLSSAVRGGLFHPNCRHTISLYIDGVTKPPRVLDEEKIKENYRKEQQFRALENKARKAKRKVLGTSDEENINKAKQELRESQKKLREFLKENTQFRRDYHREKVYEGENTVAKSHESDIIRENNTKEITPITDVAIKKVPNVKISGYTGEQCIRIQEQHRELLEYSRDKNDSKEVAFVFDSDISNRKEFIGSDDKLEFGSVLYGKDLILLHNHPRNSSYSLNDVIEFVCNESIKTISIVKNNGNVEILTKLGKYNKLLLLKELQRLEKNNVKIGSDSEYRKVVDKFLNKHVSGGIIEWLK